jgi:hypothetical protein
MATKILTAYDCSGGETLSSAVVNVAKLILHATVTGAADEMEIIFTVMAKEGAGNYTPVRSGDELKPINFRTLGNGDFRATIDGIESESVKINVAPSGAGTVSIESLKTDKTAV